MIDELKQVMLLEAIRSAGNPSYPIKDNWAYLMDEIEYLIAEGLLSVENDEILITDDGSEVLHLFDEERQSILSDCEVYKEVQIEGKSLDARLPLMAFKTRKMDEEEAKRLLRSLSLVIHWDVYFTNLRCFEGGTVNWQRMLFEAFERNYGDVNRYCWAMMGRTLKDAIMTCERLLNPIPSTAMVQITRQS